MRSQASGVLDHANQGEENYGADESRDERTDEPHRIELKEVQEEASEPRSNNADNQVTQQPESAPAHHMAGDPAGNKSDN